MDFPAAGCACRWSPSPRRAASIFPPARVFHCTRHYGRSTRRKPVRMTAVDTFELLPSLAQGGLSETGAPELVAAVFRSPASGTLWLGRAGGKGIRAFFRAGDMCGPAYFGGFMSLAPVP